MKSESPRYFWPFAFRQGKAKERWFQVLHSKLVAEAESDSANISIFSIKVMQWIFLCRAFNEQQKHGAPLNIFILFLNIISRPYHYHGVITHGDYIVTYNSYSQAFGNSISIFIFTRCIITR